ncbi:asparagine synthase (glutamine-hydrolyzing) [Cryobacterium sp. Hz7]|uniref:asparagine synthase (glutamine-hydrolyzing) n=1 Tax=Cryobacterium sp. Hz7 TaxID=1259166 RepID=UPI001068FA4E|nr:asparagine synthase (glutamine-hydrolyzing) [Cryobacterium sp. Hz7]TFB60250.1 asparagine synthase (glutamine-hydrolyzing) [Cryobacterium sp. Hz7]
MCGLAGCVQATGDATALADAMSRMVEAIRHRGPDQDGRWIDEGVGVALGHSRLSILDVSSAGAQPMTSADGRYVLSFNGEIYNHLVLRQTLEDNQEAPSWRSHSDTETLLECFSAWGIERTLKATVGMFAIALWDRTGHVLTLARDRMGEKPLYYGWLNSALMFGSELKALKAHPRFAAEVDRGALALLLRHNCIPAPHSIYQGIRKLMPGTYLSIPVADGSAAQGSVPRAYWSLNDVIASGSKNRYAGTETQAVDAVELALSDSVRGQMLADVPVGAFLSGGIDSSTVVAVMQAQSRHPVRTFSIGSANTGYDEAPHAKAIAECLGTEHTELYVQPGDALDVIPKLAAMYCEPFGDSSQIPTFLVSQLAHQDVTVALTGDGGDELFGGYNRYLTAHSVWARMARLPVPVRRAAKRALESVSPGTLDRMFEFAKPLLPNRFDVAYPGDKAHKLATVLGAADEASFYRRLTSNWDDPTSAVLESREPMTAFTDPDSWPPTESFEEWMMAMDTKTYMADDILVKVDRAAMATSLETRVPLLDHRLLELAWTMPVSLKIRNGEGKWLLRRVLDRHVPKELTERPKMGFGIPLGQWLRDPLRDWAEALIDESRLKREGYFRHEVVRGMWAEHLSGRRNREHQLWPVLMFQAWLSEQG